jgi:hypothetical protein
MTPSKIACAVLSVVLLLVAAPLNAAPPAKVAAFVHVVAAANNCNNATVINHPAANNNPNAVISVTYNAGFTSGDPNALFFAPGPLAVYFDDAAIPQCAGSAGRWLIYGLESTAGSAFAVGQRFNVIVVSP